MKKYILLILLILLIMPFSVSAVEGTCSWHGGVSCGAGTDWDGSAICNDGWRDSSEVYADQIACRGTRHSCTQAEAIQIDTKYGIPEKEQKMTDIGNQLIALQQEAAAIPLQLQQGAADRGVTTPVLGAQQNARLRTNAIAALQLSSEQAVAQADLQNAMNQADIECQALGATEYSQSQADFYKQLQSSQTQTQQTQNTTQYACPSNLIISGDKCVCNDGYIWNGNSCITYTQICQSKLGVNSYGDKEHCYCSVDYIYNPSQVTCIKNESQSLLPVGEASALPLDKTKASEPILPSPKPNQSPVKKLEVKESIINKATSTSSEAVQQSQKLVEPPKKGFWSKLLSWIKFW